MRHGLVVGPADAGGDVAVVVGPAPRRRPAPAPSRRPASGDGDRHRGYAHVNVWRLREAGASTDDTAARVIGAALERRPGFVSYALVRTSAREVVAVTIFETEDALARAVRAVAPLVREHVTPLTAARPERRSGPVVHYRATVR